MKYIFLILLSLLMGCGSFKPTAPEQNVSFFKNIWSKNLDSEYVSGNHPSYKLTQDLLQPIQTLVKNNNGI